MTQNGYDVLRDVFPALNAGIVAGGDDIHTAIVARDPEFDARVITHELSELRAYDRLRGEPWTQEPDRPIGVDLQSGQGGEYAPDVRESGRSCASSCSPASVGDTLRAGESAGAPRSAPPAAESHDSALTWRYSGASPPW